MTLAFFFIDPLYLIMVSPAVILMVWAQNRVHSAYRQGSQIDAHLSGAAAARHILDRAGLHDVEIEESSGFMSDHYDPRHRVVRLSRDVYHSSSATAVGIAAHESGHALQHAHGYAPLAIRNTAVPAAQFGPGLFAVLFIVGLILASMRIALGEPIMYLGLACYGGLVVFQIVNLPVEFNASTRAKALLSEYRIVDDQGAAAVKNVLDAAAWTYVAATLQTLLTFLYYAIRILGMFGGNRDE
ncbi:zinc metallopeptidase [bacterium]|nr:zinc metallopeptidase [bacterium]